MGSDNGSPMWIVYECVGIGREEIATYDKINIKSSLKKAAKRLRIPLSSINGVTYNYNIVSLNSTPLDNNIPNGGVLTIKLKS